MNVKTAINKLNELRSEMNLLSLEEIKKQKEELECLHSDLEDFTDEMAGSLWSIEESNCSVCKKTKMHGEISTYSSATICNDCDRNNCAITIESVQNYYSETQDDEQLHEFNLLRIKDKNEYIRSLMKDHFFMKWFLEKNRSAQE